MLTALLIAVGISLACLVYALPIMLLWNWLMPKIFGLITINFWEALGLCCLAAFLFKSSNTKSE